MKICRRLLSAPLVIACLMAILTGETLLAGPSGTVATLREDTAAGPAANARAGIQATVDTFEADLGGANNGNALGSMGTGRRKITWDGGDSLAAPSLMPGDFFNAAAPRGAIFFGADGRAQFQVSADATPSVPGTPDEFGNVNATYPTAFATFSAPRLFTALNDNVIHLRFHVPGSNRPATVKGFGAVFTDVDVAGSTRIELFDLVGRRIFSRSVLASPGNESLSFLGVTFTEAIVHSVRITCGATSLGPNDLTQGGAEDIVVLDDCIYGEPIPIIEALSHTRHRAPTDSDTFFAAPGSAVVNGEGETLFFHRLSGLGATRFRNQAIFTTAGTPGTGLVVQSGITDVTGDTLPVGTMATQIAHPLFNQPDQFLFQATLRGIGVTPANRSALLIDNGFDTRVLVRTGTPVDGLAGTMSQIREVVQSTLADATLLPVWYRLHRRDGVTRANDTGIHTLTPTGSATLALVREGQPAFGGSGDDFGENSGMASVGVPQFGDSRYVNFRSFIRPATGGPALDGLFYNRATGGHSGESARQSDASPGVAGATYRRFLGSTPIGAAHLFRATITGPGVTPGNNEGIWREISGLLLRKGDIMAPSNFTLRRIVKFWPIGDDVLVHGIISGPGVNSTNNQALLLWSAGTVDVLFRTGEVVPEATPATATVARFQAIDFAPSTGFLTVLVSLRGATPASNQILLRGLLRQPLKKVLQKGDFFCSTISPGAEVRGISLRPIHDRSGACGRGQSQTIGAAGHIVATLITDLRERELVLLP